MECRQQKLRLRRSCAVRQFFRGRRLQNLSKTCLLQRLQRDCFVKLLEILPRSQPIRTILLHIQSRPLTINWLYCAIQSLLTLIVLTMVMASSLAVNLNHMILLCVSICPYQQRTNRKCLIKTMDRKR